VLHNKIEFTLQNKYTRIRSLIANHQIST